MRTTIFLLAVLLLATCTKYEKIEDFPIEQPRLVVNSLFNHGEPFQFRISRSLSVLDNARLTQIAGAKIILYRDNIAVDTLNGADDDENYVSDIIAERNKEYSIKVSYPKYDPVGSNIEKLPPALMIKDFSFTLLDSLSFMYHGFSQTGHDTIITNYRLDCSITIHDDPGQGNVYSVSVIKFDSAGYYYYDPSQGSSRWLESKPYILLSDDPSLISSSGVGSSGIYQNQLFLSDDLFNGQEYKFRFTLHDHVWTTHARKYYIVVRSYSPSSYFYARSRGDNLDFASPFDEPAKVYSNIKGGYGIFAGFEKVKIPVRGN
jgi:hypothetical protein